MDIKKGYIGRSAYRFFTRKNNPIRPDTAKQTDLLTILLADRRSAESIMEYAKGDLRNLNGIELKELLSLPKVGEAAAAKLVSLFALIEHLLSRPLQPSDSDG